MKLRHLNNWYRLPHLPLTIHTDASMYFKLLPNNRTDVSNEIPQAKEEFLTSSYTEKLSSPNRFPSTPGRSVSLSYISYPLEFSALRGKKILITFLKTKTT